MTYKQLIEEVRRLTKGNGEFSVEAEYWSWPANEYREAQESLEWDIWYKDAHYKGDTPETALGNLRAALFPAEPKTQLDRVDA